MALQDLATIPIPQWSPQPQQPASPFTWGSGGAILTPEELANRRAIAQAMMKSNYSPVSSVWEGLGRVADNVLGAIDAHNLDKEAKAQVARSNAVAQALVGGGSNASQIAAQALTDPYVSQDVQGLAKMVWERQNPKYEPHYWETNNGSLGMVGPDGKPSILYQDPTPKLQWITADNPDGTKTVIPVGPNGPMMGGTQGATPPAVLPPDFFNGQQGGPSHPAAGGFRP